MTAAWIAFDAFNAAKIAAADEKDRHRWEALRITHWIAAETIAACAGGLLLEGAQATRAALEQALAGAAGVVFFAHGDHSSIDGGDGECALDRKNVGVLRDRWVHAIACNTGNELINRAIDAQARCYAGYEATLKVDWDVERVPPQLRTLLATLVTVISRELIAGRFDEPRLRALVHAASDEVLAYLIDDEELCGDLALTTFASQLRTRLVIRVQG